MSEEKSKPIDDRGLGKKGVSAEGTTMTQAIFSLCKSAIGFGAFRLSKHFASIGYVPCILMLILCSITTTASLHFLSRLTSRTQASSYFSIGKLALGATGEIICMISLCLFLIGGLISYIANAGVCLAMGIDQLFGTSICGNSHYQNMVIIIIAVLIYPIACLRDMRVLAKTSMIGMACMFYTLVLYFIAFIYHKSVQNVDPQIVFSAFKPFLCACNNEFRFRFRFFLCINTICVYYYS
jgi:amino acid permease